LIPQKPPANPILLEKIEHFYYKGILETFNYGALETSFDLKQGIPAGVDFPEGVLIRFLGSVRYIYINGHKDCLIYPRPPPRIRHVIPYADPNLFKKIWGLMRGRIEFGINSYKFMQTGLVSDVERERRSIWSVFGTEANGVYKQLMNKQKEYAQREKMYSDTLDYFDREFN